jgi:hypothetical protein
MTAPPGPAVTDTSDFKALTSSQALHLCALRPSLFQFLIVIFSWHSLTLMWTLHLTSLVFSSIN